MTNRLAHDLGLGSIFATFGAFCLHEVVGLPFEHRYSSEKVAAQVALHTIALFAFETLSRQVPRESAIPTSE